MTREEAQKRLGKWVKTCDSGGREREGILVSIDQDDQAYIQYRSMASMISCTSVISSNYGVRQRLKRGMPTPRGGADRVTT